MRFYTLRIGVGGGAPAVQIVAVTTLRDAAGQPFAPLSLDPEGLALTKDDTLVITSEGFANRLIDPWVREFGLDGRQLGALPVPVRLPAERRRHPRRAPEPRLRERGDAAERPLPLHRRPRTRSSRTARPRPSPPAARRGSSATTSQRRRARPAVRLLDGSDRRAARAREPVRGQRPRRAAAAEQPVPALDGALVLGRRARAPATRSSSTTSRSRARTTSTASTASRRCSPASEPVEKTLLLDLDELGIPLDNVEGMAFGPNLPDGRRSLILVSDNNFSPGRLHAVPALRGVLETARKPA